MWSNCGCARPCLHLVNATSSPGAAPGSHPSSPLLERSRCSLLLHRWCWGPDLALGSLQSHGQAVPMGPGQGRWRSRQGEQRHLSHWSAGTGARRRRTFSHDPRARNVKPTKRYWVNMGPGEAEMGIFLTRELLGSLCSSFSETFSEAGESTPRTQRQGSVLGHRRRKLLDNMRTGCVLAASRPMEEKAARNYKQIEDRRSAVTSFSVLTFSFLNYSCLIVTIDCNCES